MDERRESPRIGFNLKIGIKCRNGPIELLRPNLSWGGVGGYTRDPVPLGEAVSITLSFSQRSGEIISETISGKIIWTRRDGNFNALGIGFSKVEAASHPNLVSYLHYSEQFE